MSGMPWTKQLNGEYNEHVAIILGKEVTIFSDRDGNEWACYVGEEESYKLQATTLEEAMKEAQNDFLKS